MEKGFDLCATGRTGIRPAMCGERKDADLIVSEKAEIAV
jgi:hypothetical protein